VAEQRRIQCTRCKFRGRTRAATPLPCPECGAPTTTAATGRPRKSVADRLRDEADLLRALADELDE